VTAPLHARRCPNCEAEAPRRYCPECGQDQERSLRVSLRHLLPEALEQAVSLDSRFGRTFGRLLFQPGRVTADYLEGRRARYSSPVNLYLLASFLYFICQALPPASEGEIARQAGEAAREEAARALAQAERDVSPEAREALAFARTPVEGGNPPAGRTGESLERAERWLRGQRWPGPALAARLHEVRALPPGEAGRRMRTAFVQNAPRALFFLVPVMALWLKLLWPRRFYAEHLVFSLHAQSVTFLALLPGLFLPALQAAAVPVAIGWSVLALRRAYGGGWAGVLVRGAALGAALSASLALSLLAAAVAAFLVF